MVVPGKVKKSEIVCVLNNCVKIELKRRKSIQETLLGELVEVVLFGSFVCFPLGFASFSFSKLH